VLWSADGKNSAVFGLTVWATTGEGRTPMNRNGSRANKREIRTAFRLRAVTPAVQFFTTYEALVQVLGHAQ
jgi:hypothetical protein